MGGMKANVFWAGGSTYLYTIAISDSEGNEVEDFYHDFVNYMPYSETEEYVRNVLAEYISVHKSFKDKVKYIRYKM